MRRLPLLTVACLCLAAAPCLADGASEKAAPAPNAPEMKLPADLVYQTNTGPDQAVVFSHQTHVALANNLCGGCHPAVFHLVHPTRQTSHEEMNSGRSCGVCHDGKTAFSTKDEGSCSTCHTGLPQAATLAPASAHPAAAAQTQQPPATPVGSRSVEAVSNRDADPSKSPASAPPASPAQKPLPARSKPVQESSRATVSPPPTEAGPPAAAPAPAASAAGSSATRPGPPDVAIQGSGGSPAPVVFRHQTHTRAGGACRNCHPAPFAMKAGATAAAKTSGFYHEKGCGSCHDGKKAFGVDDSDSCGRCHAEGSPRP